MAPRVIGRASFGRFTLLRKLGAGGMGEVHLAFDPVLERRFALKIINPTRQGGSAGRASPTDPCEEQQRLQDEARALARLDHPNIVDVFDVGLVQNQMYMAMSFVAGQSLRAWLDQRERSWRSVTELMVQAGHGLSCAHEHGLIHRDFKPDNVMVDPQGRAVVIDFGIARKLDGVMPPLLDDDELGPAAAIFDPYQLDYSTITGTIMGTPGYMAPEQWLGHPSDERSDEFAFCVTYFEALYGVRPFQAGRATARSRKEIEAQIPAGRPSSTPRWLHELIVRGLSEDPEKRHGSVARLICAIETRLELAYHGRRQLRWAPLYLLCIASAWMLVAAALTRAEGPRCDDGRASWQEVWSPGVKAAIEAAFVRTGQAWSRDTWRRVERRIDTHARSSLQLHRDLCRDTQDQYGPPAIDLDLRRRCLQIDLQRLSTLIDAFGRADTELVDRAVTAVDAMPDVQQCADAQSLRRRAPWPTDPDKLAAVQTLREELAGVDALLEAGHAYAARERSWILESRAREINDDAVLAEVYSRLATAQGDLYENTRATAHAERAFELAIASGHRRVSADALIELIHLRGYRLRQIDRAQALVPAARAQLLSAHTPAELTGNLQSVRGILSSLQGDQREAERLFLDAVEWLRMQFGDDHSRVATTLSYVGNAYFYQHDFVRAIEMYERAIEGLEGALGDHHPSVAARIGNLAIALRMQGRLSESARYAERSFELCEAAHGHGHLSCAFDRQQAAWSYGALEQFADAQRILEPILDAQLRQGRRGGPSVLWAEVRLSEAALGQGDVQRGIELAEIGLEKVRSNEQIYPALMAIAYRAAARAQLAAGRPKHALQSIQSAFVELERDPRGAGEFEHHRLLWTRGDIQLALGWPRRALDDHQAALDGAGEYYGVDNDNLAEYHRQLSISLLRSGALEQAERHAAMGLAQRERAVGMQHRSLNKYLQARARVAMATGQFDRARSYVARAQALLDGRAAHRPDSIELDRLQVELEQRAAHWAP